MIDCNNSKHQKIDACLLHAKNETKIQWLLAFCFKDVTVFFSKWKSNEMALVVLF